MSSTTTDTAVRTSIVVETPIERAFEVFTAEMQSWWPKEHHILQGELEAMVVEAHPGGRIYDRATDGSECTWAHVLAYEPPRRFCFSWAVSLTWEVETDPAKRSEVDITFLAEAPDRTRVEVEHRELQRHGDGWEQMRDAVGGPDGWAVGLRRFANAAAAAS